MLQTLKQIYTDSPFPVAVYDGELCLLWNNSAADTVSEAERQQMRDVHRSLRTEQLVAELAERGIAHCRRNPASSEQGITFLRQGDYIVALYDKKTAPEAGKPLFCNLCGTDSISASVRSDVDGIVLATTALERMLDCDDPEAQELFLRARRGSYRILRNVNNMTLLARYYDGTLTLNKKTVDVGELVKAICCAAQDVCGTKVPITVHNADVGICTTVEVTLFERAFINVLLNAMQYTADGNAVDVTISETAASVAVTVRDKGTGIKAELLPYARTPYFSAEPAGDSNARPGVGLGLTVASIFCSLHGGALFLESEFGRGTTVVLSFAKETGTPETTVHASSRKYVTDRFSPVYVELCDLCDIPN